MDEDGYLAYFCKAGDGVVDVQLIADLHKSEVFKVGAAVGVPASTLEAAPSADLWDGQTDEDELGFSYEFVELLTGAFLGTDDAGRAAFKVREPGSAWRARGRALWSPLVSYSTSKVSLRRVCLSDVTSTLTAPSRPGLPWGGGGRPVRQVGSCGGSREPAQQPQARRDQEPERAQALVGVNTKAAGPVAKKSTRREGQV